MCRCRKSTGDTYSARGRSNTIFATNLQIGVNTWLKHSWVLTWILFPQNCIVHLGQLLNGFTGGFDYRWISSSVVLKLMGVTFKAEWPRNDNCNGAREIVLLLQSRTFPLTWGVPPAFQRMCVWGHLQHQASLMLQKALIRNWSYSQSKISTAYSAQAANPTHTLQNAGVSPLPW